MAQANKIKTDSIDAPTTREEAEQLLKQIGGLQNQVTAIEGNMNDQLIKIKEKFEVKAKPLNDEIADKFHALHIWAEANKITLLNGKAKTAKIATGELSWRTTPPSCRLTKQGVVIETLKRMNLLEMIRTKEEVNKEAVLANPEAVEGIAGISISQREEFVAKPFETNIERAEVVKKAPKK